MPPKQKSNKTLYTILGVIGGLVVVAIIGCIVISSLAKKAVTTGLATINQTETAVAQQTNNAEATATAAAGQLTGNPVTGPHITKIQMGTGFDQNTGAVIGETYNFTKG
jgi:flagellar basal body-associated protein FliL